jgi:superfamily II DNA or RNA helicase
MINILRPYQKEDYQNIVNKFKQHNSILYQAPTGSGKSVIIEQFILDNKTKNIIILVHKRELLFQMKERLNSNGLKVGIIIGGIEEDLDSNIILASIRTVSLDKRIQSIINTKHDFIIVDESHHIRTSSFEKVIDLSKSNSPNVKLLGVTATPYRKDKKPLNKYFEVLICSKDINTLQHEGFLSKYKVFYTPASNIDQEVETSGNDYKIQSLSHYMRKPEMIQFMVDSYVKFGENRQMIIFCVDKKHAKDVKEKYIENGFKKLAYIDSNTKLSDRKQILLNFQNQKIQIIICIETLTEGVDLPETKCIQLGRPTQSLTLYLQMVGRGSRLKEDGSECIILDNAGCSLTHKLPNSPRHWSLNPNIDPSNPSDKNKIVGKRKNGTYTDDEEEMEFLELIEMTPEEYALNISGGIEKSEKINNQYDEQCHKILEEISNIIITKCKLKDYIYLKPTYYDLNTVNINKGEYQITISHNKSSKCLELSSSTPWRIKTPTLVLDNQRCIGLVANEFLKEKIYDLILNMFEQIITIQKKKINISELKLKAKEFKKEQLIINLTQWVLVNQTIELKNEQSLNAYFRYGYYSRSNWFKSIKFHNNKFNMTSNEISFISGDGEVISTKKSIKRDKIVEIIESAGWSQ